MKKLIAILILMINSILVQAASNGPAGNGESEKSAPAGLTEELRKEKLSHALRQLLESVAKVKSNVDFTGVEGDHYRVGALTTDADNFSGLSTTFTNNIIKALTENGELNRQQQVLVGFINNILEKLEEAVYPSLADIPVRQIFSRTQEKLNATIRNALTFKTIAPRNIDTINTKIDRLTEFLNQLAVDPHQAEGLDVRAIALGLKVANNALEIANTYF